VKAPADWFEHFFSGLAVEFWRAAVPEAATLEETGFLWKHLSLSAGSRVLDVPCGHGRLSIALAARGCAVTGVDISEEFLRAAGDGARQAGASIVWRQSDMRDLPWTEAFDAAFCFGNSFGFLDDAGDEAFLESVARALEPGRRFVLDYGQSAESVFPRLEARLEAEIGGFRFEEETRYDIASARIENRYTISRGAEREEKLASQRVYLASDVARMLENAGFQVLATFGSAAEDPFALSAQRHLTVAEKTV
jgi:SAM-dependent methyltransferase